MEKDGLNVVIRDNTYTLWREPNGELQAIFEQAELNPALWTLSWNIRLDFDPYLSEIQY
jgi:hypothetical protein